MAFVYAKYDEKTAQDMLLASALAYCPADKIMLGNCMQATIKTEQAGIIPIHSKDNGSTSDPITYAIMVRKSKKQIIVAFSGTAGFTELIDEIEQVLPVSYSLHDSPGAQVFNFFFDHYNNDFRVDFMKNIMIAVKEYSGYSVIFTGHSLGGALTVHACADAILSGAILKNKVYLYTYGQPRVGNQQFNDLFHSKLNGAFRLTHNRDLVPHVPPCIPDGLHN